MSHVGTCANIRTFPLLACWQDADDCNSISSVTVSCYLLDR